jgi:C4-dicarboxylate-specific signal transduction histidine kinase
MDEVDRWNVIAEQNARNRVFEDIFPLAVHDAMNNLHRAKSMLVTSSTILKRVRAKDGEPIVAIDDYLKRTIAYIEAAMRLVDGLREVARERPSKEPHSKFSLAEVISEASESLRVSLGRSGIRITNKIPKSAIIVGPRHTFVFVVLQLVLNAIEANDLANRPTAGVIQFTMKSSGSGTEVRKSIQIDCRDNGPGFSESLEDAKKYFEPFTTSRRDKAGLGLFVARQLIRSFPDGELELISCKPATFRMTFSA